MAYLGHHLKQNTCHLLLKEAAQEGGEEQVGGEREAATNDEFFESLSTAQLSRVRNQTLAVRMYLINLDRHHPELSVDECAADVADSLGYMCRGRVRNSSCSGGGRAGTYSSDVDGWTAARAVATATLQDL